MTDEFAKARREKLTPYLPVANNTWRGDIMPKKFLPATPELFIHQPVDVMKVNRLERLEKLVGGMKETGLILGGERLEVLQTRSPNARHFGIFHERVCHLPDRRRGGILGRYPGDARAAVHFFGEIKHRQDDSD